MDRRPGRALVTTYVRPASKPGRYQVRARDAATGRDVKVTTDSLDEALRQARKKASA